MGERLEPGSPARAGAAYSLGHGTHPPVLTGQQGDDAVGLAQLVGAQHDRLVAIEGHPPILPRSGAGTTPPAGVFQQARAKSAASRFSRSGRARHSKMLRARRNVALGISSASIAASAAGWIGSAGWPTISAGACDGAPFARRRGDPPEEESVHDRGHRVGTLVAGVEADAHPEGDQATRDRPGEHPDAVDGEGQEPGREHQRPEGQDPGLQRVVEDRHLDDQAAHPLGGECRRPRARRWLPARCRRRRPGELPGGRAGRSPAGRKPSSSRRAGRPVGPSGRGPAGRASPRAAPRRPGPGPAVGASGAASAGRAATPPTTRRRRTRCTRAGRERIPCRRRTGQSVRRQAWCAMYPWQWAATGRCAQSGTFRRHMTDNGRHDRLGPSPVRRRTRCARRAGRHLHRGHPGGPLRSRRRPGRRVVAGRRHRGEPPGAGATRLVARPGRRRRRLGRCREPHRRPGRSTSRSASASPTRPRRSWPAWC